MAYSVDSNEAREFLQEALDAAETAYQSGAPPSVSDDLAADIERLFTSSTQAYREALVGCVIARHVDGRINIRHPATETSDDAFSGRSLADQIVTPYLQDRGFPVSRSPYLSCLRGGARFEPNRAPRIQRDAGGFAALVSAVEHVAEAPPEEAIKCLIFLLYRFVVLREQAQIELRRIARPNLHQLTKLIAGLLSVRSGGRFSALLATAMFQTISDCHGLEWEVEFQGINVADAASGAVGDITVKKQGVIVLGVEVTERTIDRGRVAATFERKVAPNGLEDYLFITTTQPETDALTAAHNYTGVGHEMNFVQLQAWLTNNLATVGPQCRAIFQAKILDLLVTQNADLKVAWNDKMDAAIGP